MLISDVVGAKQLRIKPLFVTDGALERVVSWTFTTDLLDPRRYLIRGQLVMTGLVWRRTPEDSEPFVSAVARAGAIALLAGEGLYGRIPDDIVESCRRHDLPLFAVPADVSFASITAYISNALANDRVTRVMSSLTRQRELLTEVYQGHLLDDLVSRTSREIGRPIWLVTATGRHFVHPVEPMDDLDLERVVAAALSAERLPVTVTDAQGGRLIVFGVSGPDDHRTMAWFLVVAGDWNEWHPLILDTAQELTAVAGLYRVQGTGPAEVSTALVDRLLALIDSGVDEPETAVYRRQIGIPDHQQTVVVAAEFPGHPELQDLALFLLGDAISHVAAPVVGRDGDSRAVALLAVESGDLGERPAELEAVQQALRRLGPGLGGRRLRVGVSQVASLGELGGALRSARFALTLPDAPGAAAGEVRISDAQDLTSAVQLLAAVPDHLRRVFVDLALGPVIEHDTRYNSQLVSTLSTFLDTGGSWVRTAELTHLHLNTVRYRMGRIEELTGRDLSRTADRADLYLALKLS